MAIEAEMLSGKGVMDWPLLGLPSEGWVVRSGKASQGKLHTGEMFGTWEVPDGCMLKWRRKG